MRHPVFLTQISGAAHKLVFLSIVDCEGEHFIGEEANTKKQAEMNAAMVAYTNLRKRKRLWLCLSQWENAIHATVTITDLGSIILTYNDIQLV
ncbi:hypothetical protein Lal_00045621 [Lupinus albus]|nr:hypothetical protein Lal_00045621 [Lupinus albus]